MLDGIVVSVVGLGYVGLPVAIAMSKKFKVIGFDIKSSRVQELQRGVDSTNEVQLADLKNPNLLLTDEAIHLKQANFHIVTVPTPIDEAHQPDLTAIRSASKFLAEILKKGDIVVYESTVYPGLTEELCVPILENISGLKYKVDFKVGYSPERINPGDVQHRFETIKKVVSGCDSESLELISSVYGAVVKAGIHKAPSIVVAEAAKVIENTQRDLNVALINELALIFHRMNIDTMDVLDAAGSKWNFLPFKPGLVGGHCIGVDPYYLTHQAEKFGYIPQVILAGRRVNDNMGNYVAQELIKKMSLSGLKIKNAHIGICGITFKENCPDIRNSRVIDIIDSLKEYGPRISVVDPWAHTKEVHEEYGFSLVNWEDLSPCDAMVMAVSHNQFKKMDISSLIEKMNKPYILFDIKSIYSQDALAQAGVLHWRL